MTDRYSLEEALLNQLAAQISNNYVEFYQHMPTLEMGVEYKDRNDVILPINASWKLIEEYSCSACVHVKIKAGDKTLGGSINGEFKSSITGVNKRGIPETNYAEVAQRISFLCKDLEKSLLDNLAKQQMDNLQSVLNIMDHNTTT